MINSLSLSNFKSWKNADLRLGKLTGLFGTNSSGKSSLIHFLLMLKQTAESSDRAQVLDFGDEKSFVELGTFKDVIYDHDTSRSINFSVDWSLGETLKIIDPTRKGKNLFEGKGIGFGCEIMQTEKGRLYVQKFSYDFSGFQFFDGKGQKDSYKYQTLCISFS
ncbi:MAG: AAA family ATPase [Saprospiraceae bacterium]